ncbi:MAG TPA: hypothetical protein VHL85_07375 [Burkholderiales bacterium]|jgi:hypothetical protein|nr:hypothetical protein [Burkholderiales bacterium]
MLGFDILDWLELITMIGLGLLGLGLLRRISNLEDEIRLLRETLDLRFPPK